MYCLPVTPAPDHFPEWSSCPFPPLSLHLMMPDTLKRLGYQIRSLFVFSVRNSDILIGFREHDQDKYSPHPPPSYLIINTPHQDFLHTHYITIIGILSIFIP